MTCADPSSKGSPNLVYFGKSYTCLHVLCVYGRDDVDVAVKYGEMCRLHNGNEEMGINLSHKEVVGE